MKQGLPCVLKLVMVVMLKDPICQVTFFPVDSTIEGSREAARMDDNT